MHVEDNVGVLAVGLFCAGASEFSAAGLDVFAKLLYVNGVERLD